MTTARQSRIGQAYISLVPSFTGFFTAIDANFKEQMPKIMVHTFDTISGPLGKKFAEDWVGGFKPVFEQALRHAANTPINIPAPHVPPIVIPVPQIPAPVWPTLHVPQITYPTPIIPDPHVPTVNIPAPHVPAPVVAPVNIPAPQVPAPHIATPPASATAGVGQHIGQALGGSMVLSMGKALLAGAAALELGGKLKEAISGSMETQKGNAKLQAQLGMNDGQSAVVAKAGAKVFADAYGESKDQVSESMYQIVSSIKGARGASATELEKMSKDSLNLSSAFGLETGAVAAAAQSMITNGIASNWQDAVDVVTKGYQTMGKNGEDWIDTLHEYSGSFASFGLNAKQAYSAINTMVTQGGFMNTDTAADALREVGIQARSGENADFLKQIGLNPDEVKAAANKGGQAWISEFQKVMVGLQKNGDKSLYGAILGTQAEDQLNAVMKTDWSKIGSGVEDVTGSADKLDKTLNNSTASTMEQFMRTMQNLFIQVVQPAINWVTPKLQAMATWLDKNAWAVNALAVVIGGAFMIAIVAATVALWGMVAPVLANPMTWIILGAVAAIGLLIAASVWLVQNWTSIVIVGEQLFGGLFNWIGQSLGDVGNWFVGLGKGIGNFFIGIANSVIGLVNMMIDALNSIKFEAPAWLGGMKWNGLNIPKVGAIPQLAQGATILPSAGGTLVNVAEAGKPESVVDTGLLNRQLAASAKANENNGGGHGPVHIKYEIHQLPGESTDELIRRMDERRDMLGYHH